MISFLIFHFFHITCLTKKQTVNHGLNKYIISLSLLKTQPINITLAGDLSLSLSYSPSCYAARRPVTTYEAMSIYIYIYIYILIFGLA